MKKKRLEIDYSYDFELLGVISSIKGYRLAWQINRQLNVRLIKQADLVIHLKNKATCTYVYFAHDATVNKLKLFRNKPNEPDHLKNFLVPEFPHLDYILMAQGEDLNSNRLQEELRKIPSVELAAFIPLDTLKSRENFIF